MKKIWNVEMKAMNGSITMMIQTHAFTTKEVAEKAAEAIKEKNKDSVFHVITRVYDSELYESENEVPILNN